jgi:hypothetical protein
MTPAEQNALSQLLYVATAPGNSSNRVGATDAVAGFAVALGLDGFSNNSQAMLAEAANWLLYRWTPQQFKADPQAVVDDLTPYVEAAGLDATEAGGTPITALMAFFYPEAWTVFQITAQVESVAPDDNLALAAMEMDHKMPHRTTNGTPRHHGYGNLAREVAAAVAALA